MVRLKDGNWEHIKVKYANFNSNMVRLKGGDRVPVNALLFHFNSNMVRLKGDSLVLSFIRIVISIPIWCD